MRRYFPKWLFTTVLSAFLLLVTFGSYAQDAAPGTVSSSERPEYRINYRGLISDRGLVSVWRGDGSAADGTGRNSGQVVGGVTFVPAMVGQGFRFNGTDGGITIPDSESLRLGGGSMTIACWLFIESFPAREQGAAMILFRGDDRSGNDPYRLHIDSRGRVAFSIESETGGGADISAPLPAGRFVHVAATLDRESGRMRLYENGEAVAETTYAHAPMPSLDPAANPGIGIGNHGGRPASPFSYPFHGVINELRLYSRALSASEVRAMYQDRTEVAALSRP